MLYFNPRTKCDVGTEFIARKALKRFAMVALFANS